MRYLIVFVMILSSNCFAQQLRGIVTNAQDKMPVANALVTMGKNHVYTDAFGQFSIDNSGNASLIVSHMAFKTYKGMVSKAVANLRVALEPIPIALREVNIHVHREEEFKKDSVANRQFYASQFNYTGPKVMDAFTGNPMKQPDELISINPVLLIQALTKKSTPEYKFHKALLNNEQADYVNHRFNRGIVSRVTGLKGDTLSAFIIKYRPEYNFVHRSADYEIEVYIKDCYRKFVRDGMKVDMLFMKNP